MSLADSDERHTCLIRISELVQTENERAIYEFIESNNDGIMFFGGISDFSDILNIPKIETLRFFAKMLNHELIRTGEADGSRYIFLKGALNA